MNMHLRLALVPAIAAFAAACGGGGSSAPPAPPVVQPPPTTVAPPPGPSRAELAYASKFASRATFGLPYPQIEEIAEQGAEAWLEQQFELPVTESKPVADKLKGRRAAGQFNDLDGVDLIFQFWRFAWWHTTMTAEDVVRQRVGFALSEIFVVSNIDMLNDEPWALTNYYDTLLHGAFGNFRDLLRDVALHPSMGIYLSHVNNRKADPASNTFPDENFAREVMQLFTIGLYELNIDGSLRLDANGAPIPTYDNHDIAEFAKVFTGLSYGGKDARFGKRKAWFLAPMQMFEEHHEPGEKQLLGGVTLAAGQTGMEDVEAALDNLFEHPNVGPFIGRQLIQRLVTSNPSSAYVERVARAFNGDDTGVRGDMRAVLRAILLDPEATQPREPSTFGKLREPALRLVALARQFKANSDDGTFYNAGHRLNHYTGQHPLASPSVFNFFLPNHSPPGLIADAGLVGPEFQITTPTTIIGAVNMIDVGVFRENQLFDVPEPFAKANLNLTAYRPLANDVDDLLERLDLVMTQGEMHADTRAAVRAALVGIDDPLTRVRQAIYLIAMSPDYTVES